MEEEIKQRLQNKYFWQRGLYILFFIFIYGLSNSLIIAIVLFQYVTLIVTGKTNPLLLGFSQNLSAYIHQIISFLSFNADLRPFPFSAWPQEADSNSKCNL
ncbi:DUF4389 domain-containing protein [Nitrosomonas supralitoralis]|uniref:DUF4389 domain-containing protein n=1 Tax=Nitrosomonas supralitoralis TaxID=2116706 RepID=A0A2P7NY59_9PROT|nr:DUF4389 domain-containing protein [Nitrosomonas supralitoralis]PSJ18405.1 DUF4389 domain-containing protein [Nitrosomonas supralitoralis]